LRGVISFNINQSTFISNNGKSTFQSAIATSLSIATDQVVVYNVTGATAFNFYVIANNSINV